MRTVFQVNPTLSVESFSRGEIGNLHDGVILLLRPGSFRVLLSCVNEGFCYLNLTGATKFKYEKKTQKNSGHSSRHLENALLSFLFFSIMRFLFFLIFTTGENTVFCSAKILSERSYKGVNIALVYRYERALWLCPCDHQ